jgi:hypothetical protein
VAALASGCEPDETKVRIRIGVEADVPGQVDLIRVIATAARDEAGHFCVPVVRSFDLTSGADLPLIVDFRPGPRYRSWAYLRVDWFGGGVRVGGRDWWRSFPASGTREEELVLEAACVALRCAEEQQCVSGECRSFRTPSPLDPGNLDTAILCDSDETAFEVGDGTSDGAEVGSDAGEDDGGD